MPCTAQGSPWLSADRGPCFVGGIFLVQSISCLSRNAPTPCYYCTITPGGPNNCKHFLFFSLFFFASSSSSRFVKVSPAVGGGLKGRRLLPHGGLQREGSRVRSMCGSLSVPHRSSGGGGRRAGTACAQRAASASFLVPEAAVGRWCPLTQEPKLLAETLIAISSPRPPRPQATAAPARGKPRA